MHVLRVATWNAEGMFVAGSMTRRASPHDAIKAIKKLDADVVMIPEFGVKGGLEEPIRIAIHSLGYQIIEAPYDDPSMPSHVPKNYEMAILTRLPLRSHTLHHFKNSGRVFIEAMIELPHGKDILRVFGIHLDDKKESLRLEQMNQLVKLINKPHVGETVVLGDFNAMGPRSVAAKFLGAKTIGRIGSHLPGKQLRSMSERVNQMAIGTTIKLLAEKTELYDLDPGHHFTISAKQSGLEWAPKVRLAKIDWIFGTKNITTITYKVLPDAGSDHRPVRASLCIR